MTTVRAAHQTRTSDRDEASEENRRLVRACLAGDERAWGRFVGLYQGFALSVAQQWLQRAGVDDPTSQAEDVVSDMFAELLADDCRALSRFCAPFSLKSWLAVITRRRASRHLRRQRRAPGRLDEPSRVESGRCSVVSDMAKIESCSKVRARIDDLLPRDQLALRLFYEGGRSYKEVAEVLEMPVNRVGTLLARARTRLLKALCV